MESKLCSAHYEFTGYIKVKRNPGTFAYYVINIFDETKIRINSLSKYAEYSQISKWYFFPLNFQEVQFKSRVTGKRLGTFYIYLREALCF